jgi:hypothetical protein
MPERRLDDRVDGNGDPMSPAHAALMEKVETCKQELIADHANKLSEMEDRHNEERHHPPLNEIAKQLGKTPTELMGSFITSMQTSERVVDALDGPLVEGLDGHKHRVEEEGVIWQMKDMQDQMKNGIVHKAKLTIPQWTFLGVLVSGIFGILIALINSGATP